MVALEQIEVESSSSQRHCEALSALEALTSLKGPTTLNGLACVQRTSDVAVDDDHGGEEEDEEDEEDEEGQEGDEGDESDESEEDEEDGEEEGSSGDEDCDGDEEDADDEEEEKVKDKGRTENANYGESAAEARECHGDNESGDKGNPEQVSALEDSTSSANRGEKGVSGEQAAKVSATGPSWQQDSGKWEEQIADALSIPKEQIAGGLRDQLNGLSPADFANMKTKLDQAKSEASNVEGGEDTKGLSAEAIAKMRAQLDAVEAELNGAGLKTPKKPTNHILEGWWYEPTMPKEDDSQIGMVRGVAKASGNTAVAEGNWSFALEHYYSAMELCVAGAAELGTLHSNCSLCTLKQGSLHEALDHANAAVRLRPDWPKAHGRLATALEANGKLAEARDAYEDALRLCSASNPGAEEYRRALVRLGEEHAKALYGASSHLKPLSQMEKTEETAAAAQDREEAALWRVKREALAQQDAQLAAQQAAKQNAAHNAAAQAAKHAAAQAAERAAAQETQETQETQAVPMRHDDGEWKKGHRMEWRKEDDDEPRIVEIGEPRLVDII